MTRAKQNREVEEQRTYEKLKEDFYKEMGDKCIDPFCEIADWWLETHKQSIEKTIKLCKDIMEEWHRELGTNKHDGQMEFFLAEKYKELDLLITPTQEK